MPIKYILIYNYIIFAYMFAYMFADNISMEK